MTGTTTDRVTRVLIAEDQVMMREALALLLDQEDGLAVVGQVGRGDELVEAALSLQADVALVDIEMPGLGGLDAAAALRERAPQCAVVIVTTFGRPGYLRRALDAGVRGFVVKDGPIESLAEAIRRVVAGELVTRPHPGRRRALGRTEPAHRAGAGAADGGDRRVDRRRHRGPVAPVGADREELPFRRDRQDGDEEPDRGCRPSARTRLALTRTD